MLIVFYDFDDRDYTYWGDYSTDGSNWKSFANGIMGKGAETLRFNFDITAKYLRLKGYNDKNDNLNILKMDLDYF
eukprot:CAMPEP_0170556248 /NCGR_PEP_ID=MMETSP0211-20121228/15907_1 /TAXON_ID=311385 /ORGANISM="Pseudokeronopsis sp., Strain OXSARD2" /LENGTH=74 /DNA_ID=CAMNT_0010866463 /DNA_START=254 /DNA_END=478 /DNA_ORIENTATION=+